MDLGVNGTPALFINGQKIDGAVPISGVRAALDAALKDAGEPVPPAFAFSPGSQHPSKLLAAARFAPALRGFSNAVAVRRNCLKKTHSLPRSAAALSAAVLLAALAACNPQPGGDVMATVDGRKIFRSDVDKYYDNNVASAQQAPDGRAGHCTAPEHPAPDDRRRDPDAPRRKTRPAGHRRRS